MKIYFALTQNTEKGICVRFTEVPAAIAQGKDMDEAINLASDALGSMLVQGLRGHDYTDPRSYEQVRDMAREGETVVPIIITDKAMAKYRS